MSMIQLMPKANVATAEPACTEGDCYEGRCLWCALFLIREYVVFAYLANTSKPTNTQPQSYWCGA